MSRKKNIVLSCLLCAVIVAAVLGICFYQIQKNEPVRTAETYEQIELYVQFPSGTEEIRIWQNEEGVYYLFLPAGAENTQVVFGNVKQGDSVIIDDVRYGRNDDMGSLADTPGEYEMVLCVDGVELEPVQLCIMRSENLPAMFIDTESGSTDRIHEDKEAKEEASMRLVDSQGNSRYSGTMEYIKTRGNSTWEYEKKAYQIKLKREAGLLDMAKAQKWILLANVVDDTLIKNELVFRYAENYTTVPSIDGQFVDLYINGIYAGNYYLCEKIEVGKTRLDITDLEAATEAVNYDSSYDEARPYTSEDGKIRAFLGLNNPADITGGYLLERIPSWEYEDAENAFRTDTGNCYAIVSPSPATQEQAEYICGLFDEMEAAINAPDGINPVTGKHFSEYLDIDSWASKYVMEEVFHDPDASVGSMYLYKDKDSLDPLIYSGPMWDYDRALGSYGMNLYNIDDAKQVGNYGIYVQELMNFDEVREQVYEKFENQMAPYVENRAGADIYELDLWIKASAKMNEMRWPGIHGYYTNRAGSVGYLTNFLEEKTLYLKDVWLMEENYCTITFLDYYGNEYKSYQIKKGELLSDAPPITSYEALFAGWYVQGENIPYISGLPVLENVTYESRWIGMDVLIQNGLGALDMDLSQLAPETLSNMAEVLREMQRQSQDSQQDQEQSEEE